MTMINNDNKLDHIKCSPPELQEIEKNTTNKLLSNTKFCEVYMKDYKNFKTDGLKMEIRRYQKTF